MDEVNDISYKSTTNEGTRCYFCKNKCLRTFIDVKINQPQVEEQVQAQSELQIEEKKFKSKVPLEAGAKRLIVGNSCEKGLVEDVNDMRVI